MRASAEPARSLPVSDPAAAAMTGALCGSGDGLLAASVRLVRCSGGWCGGPWWSETMRGARQVGGDAAPAARRSTPSA